MTIEEINFLAKQEKEGLLRKPTSAQNYTQEDLQTQEQLLLRIRWFLEEEKANGFVGCLFRRIVMKKQKGVKSFQGLVTIKHPYKIETDFGGGTLYDARKGFNKKTYPEWIEQNYCYDNCLKFALLTKLDCSVLSGLAYMDKPFLHSVILVKDKIIDFNYHIVMDKELYFKLVKFECMAKVNAKQVRDTSDFVVSKRSILNKSNLKTITMNFAFDDVLDYLQNEERQIAQPELGID